MSGEIPAQTGVCPCCKTSTLVQYVPREQAGLMSGDRLVPIILPHTDSTGGLCPGIGRFPVAEKLMAETSS